ncbi:MAG: TlpA family protein disulfide reductase [Cyclobacteriaceae bacterium]|nr:TlpA family protein disulfide reductase [Cyclobacteriaceae bacterium]
MNSKSHTKRVLGGILAFIKPVGLAVLLIVVLRITGLIGAVTFATQWALLQTGFKDAETEVLDAPAQFDYGFTIKDLQGNKIPFEQFKGKVIFLNMWATWCGPCRAEMAGIQGLYEKTDKDKVAFVMLSIDEDSEMQRIATYFTKRGFTFQAYLPSGYLTEQLNVPSIPTTFIISKEGKIVKKEVGAIQYDTPKFKKFLEDLSR